jgi:AraC family transcriptional regulator
MEQVPVEGSLSEAEAAFDVPPEHIVRSSKGKGWNGVDAAEIVHPLDDFALPAIARHVLVVNLGVPTEIRERRRGRQGHLGTGNIVILPADAPTTWHLERQGEVRHLHLYISPTRLREVAAAADINPDKVELIDAMGVPDPQIEAIALAYLSELRAEGVGSQLYAESLANLLAIHLLRRHSSVKQLPLPRSHRLAETTLRRVIAHIEDHLAEDLSLSTLAAVASLSPYHFARLFKESTGLSPHQYVTRRRVERARLLLATTNWPLLVIAHASGFANESHLALHFKRITGLAPRHTR